MRPGGGERFCFLSSIVERYREWTSGSERYHELKRRAVSKGSEQLVLLVEQREEG